MVFAQNLSAPEGPVLLPDQSWLIVEMGPDKGSAEMGPDRRTAGRAEQGSTKLRSRATRMVTAGDAGPEPEARTPTPREDP